MNPYDDIFAKLERWGREAFGAAYFATWLAPDLVRRRCEVLVFLRSGPVPGGFPAPPLAMRYVLTVRCLDAVG